MTTKPGDDLSPARTYDALGLRYEQAYEGLQERIAAVEWLRDRLSVEAKVLDIGSGTGVPTARILCAAGMRVTGIDVSTTMIDIARSQVPDAKFHQIDVREFSADAGSWDAICAFFSVLQMTRQDIIGVLRKTYTWLKPGGYFCFATVPSEKDSTRGTFLGQPVESSSFTVPKLIGHMHDAGFTVVHQQVSQFLTKDPERRLETQLFVYAQRPAL